MKSWLWSLLFCNALRNLALTCYTVDQPSAGQQVKDPKRYSMRKGLPCESQVHVHQNPRSKQAGRRIKWQCLIMVTTRLFGQKIEWCSVAAHEWYTSQLLHRQSPCRIQPRLYTRRQCNVQDFGVAYLCGTGISEQWQCMCTSTTVA